jgi:ABC-2 type transport system permease protein
MSRVAVITRLELLRRIRNRSAVVTAFVAPLAIGTVFGVLIGGTSHLKFTIAVVDGDHSAVSGPFVDSVLKRPAPRGPERAGTAKDPVRFRGMSSAAAAKHAVDTGDVDAAIVVPAGFATSLARSEPAHVIVLRKATRPVSGQVAEAVVGTFATRVEQVNLAIATVSSIRPQALSQQLITAAQQLRSPVVTRDVAMGAREVSPTAFYGASMAMVFLFFTVSFAPRSLMADRRDGILARMLATPTAARDIVAGKVLAVCALSLAGFATVWLVTSVGFGATWGDPVAVIVLMFVTVLALGGVSTFVSSLAHTEQQADSYAGAVTFVLALLGGNFIGPGQAPALLRRVAMFTPNGWALRAFTDVSADAAGLPRLWWPVLVLSAFALTFGAAGLVRVRRGVEQ